MTDLIDATEWESEQLDAALDEAETPYLPCQVFVLFHGFQVRIIRIKDLCGDTENCSHDAVEYMALVEDAMPIARPPGERHWPPVIDDWYDADLLLEEIYRQLHPLRDLVGDDLELRRQAFQNAAIGLQPAFEEVAYA